MPIRPENRDRYPANWKTEVRPAILKRAENSAGWPCCEECGVANGEIGCRRADGTWDSYPWLSPGDEIEWRGKEQIVAVKIVLTIAHLDHKPENCDPANLKAWCQRCHNAYDAPMRRAGIKSRAHAERACGDLLEVLA